MNNKKMEMKNKDDMEMELEFLQLNLGHKIIAHDLFMEWLRTTSGNWICCLQEPYMSAKGVPRLPPQYGAVWSQKENGGNSKVRAMIIIPKWLNAYQLTQFSNVDEIYVNVDRINLCVASIYCQKEMLMKDKLMNLVELRKVWKKVIICMDANAYNEAWGATAKTMDKKKKNWRQTVRGVVLRQCIDDNKMCICNEIPHIPTFIRKEENKSAGATHIDVTICTEEIYENVHDWLVYNTPFLTDHNPITFKYRPGKKDIGNEVRQRKVAIPWKRPTMKMNRIMIEELEKNVTYKVRANDEEGIDKFINIHGNEVRKVLHGIFKDKKENRKKVYWWNKEVEKAHAVLKRARKRMRRYHHLRLKEEFIESRRQFRKIVYQAKIESWKSFLADIRTPWEGLIRIVRAADVGKLQTRTLADLEGKYAVNIRQTLKLLGTQFYPAPAPFTEEQIGIENVVKVELEDVSEKGPAFTVHEMRYALTQISMRSAPGADEITNNVMSVFASGKFENIYLMLFNKCLSLSYFPRCWKQAIITLIPKTGANSDTAKTFRPISLTSVYAKLLERLLLQRLQHYLKKSGKIVENQHAYRKGKSTQTALYDMFEQVQYAVNKRGGGVCVIVFLDISGAFDRTWHGGILYKLLSYDVPKYMIAMIKSFLQNRCVNFCEGGSEYEMELVQGCPQGGVLSPILWNILFNELLGMEIDQGKKKGNRMKIIGYADDAALVCKADTVSEASELLNVHLRKIHAWSIKNRVVFNSTKLAVLTICNRQTTAPPAAVYYNGILVNEVTRYKYLGIIVDNKLNWKAHIDEVIKRLDRITRSLRSINGMEWGIKVNIFRRLYTAIFLPVMTYGISIWGWKAAQKCVYERFDKEIRKFGMVALRCMKTTSNVYIRSLLNTQCFEDILTTEVLNVSVRQFHIVHTERQNTYDSYTKSIKRREYPQCIDHHYMMCRRRLNINYMSLGFDDATVIHDVHPAKWIGNDCVVSNRQEAIWKGNDQCGMNIYTDASASSYGKGWSFVVYRHRFKICQRSGSMMLCTVYQAELQAISYAVRYVIDEVVVSSKEIVEIRSDYQAAVQTLKKYVQHESLQKEIHDGLREASGRQKHICIRWIPGHSNILGNDDADSAAKKAVDSRASTEIKQTQAVIRNMIRQERRENIQRDWKRTSAHTRALLPSMHDVHRFVEASPSSALCQIVSGHTRLNDFICRKLKLISSATCECGMDDETVSHYLFDCPRYQKIRENVWLDFIAEYDFITRDWEKLQKYVDETGRFKGGCR